MSLVPLVRRLPLLVVILLSLTVLQGAPPVVLGASTTFPVTKTEDNNDGVCDMDCSLREAIVAANANPGADQIILPAGTYLLTIAGSGEDAAATGDLDITDDLTIIGAGAASTYIDGNGLDRVVHLPSPAEVTLKHVTIQGGDATAACSSANWGGGIHFTSGMITVESSIVRNNQAAEGGGISNEGGTLTLLNSTVSGNSATCKMGGGLHTGNSASNTIVNSTFSGNTAKDDGGAIYSNNATTTLDYATITNNHAHSDAGAIDHFTPGSVSLRSSIVAANTAGVSHPNCRGSFISNGHNLGPADCGLGVGSDIITNAPDVGPLQDNGGPTQTHALLAGSLAIDAGDNAACPAADQRGYGRPQDGNGDGTSICDIGAVEAVDGVTVGPPFSVNKADDTNDGFCSASHCSLREAVLAANAMGGIDTIVFNISGTIQPTTELPTITEGVTIAGDATVTLDGALLAGGEHGLVIHGADSTIQGLTITGFPGDGVRVASGTGNTITNNRIFANGGLGINLGTDGVTANDGDDGDDGANHLQNFPTLIRAVDAGAGTTIQGYLNSSPGTEFALDFYATTSCDASGFGEGERYLGALPVTTDAGGETYFRYDSADSVPEGEFVTATTIDPAGNTSEFSACLRVAPGNDSWLTAYRLDLGTGDVQTASVANHYLDRPGRARWYKFSVTPDSTIQIDLSNLPANYELTVYKDIGATFAELVVPQDLTDLVRWNAEFAPDIYSPDIYSPDIYSPDIYSPDIYSPDIYSPDIYSPDIYSPDIYSPDIYSPDIYSPDIYSPDIYSPDIYSPDIYSPDIYSPDIYSPDIYSPVFSGAQVRSLLAVSALPGTASERVVLNTWSLSGDFYVRVRGHDGSYDPDQPFHLSVTLFTGACGNVTPVLPASDTAPASGSYQTLILTDLGRMELTSGEQNDLQTKLNELASAVNGIVVDVGADAAVAFANRQADTAFDCPYAKNLVAGAIKTIVDAYRASGIQYVVLVGNDDVIPFYRYPDQALLANESTYVPPVRNETASQASLRLGYVLGQDAYGSQVDVSLGSNDLPIPDLAVGRLVEEPDEIMAVIDAYLGGVHLDNGALTPNATLVTGYDFLEDAANAIEAELAAGLGGSGVVNTLISDASLAPSQSWIASELRDLLLNSGRHDLIFLAGHFSAFSTLAADYETRLLASEIVEADVDLRNAVIYSAGCHAGYNTVNVHGVPGVTVEPDWARAFAHKGAVLIAGTGYQYGDTDFIEYSERLYLHFTEQLRTGSGPVAIGDALVAAKQQYLVDTAEMRPIHEKAYLQTVIFGLPMLQVNLPVKRTPAPDESIVSATQPAPAGPGAQLQLAHADISIDNLDGVLAQKDVQLQNTANLNEPVLATYFTGPDGLVTNPGEPILPLVQRNVTVESMVLRGVGFRGGSFTDHLDVIPLTGAPATELRGVHLPFSTPVFYPAVPWEVNYFAALRDGPTLLALTPAQFLSNASDVGEGTLRTYNNMDFRLYYSSNIATYPTGFTGTPTGEEVVNIPALAAPPDINIVSAEPDGAGNVRFRIHVTGDPSAGVQAVWVTYVTPNQNRWISLDLTQDIDDSTLWEGALPLNGIAAGDVRYMVQAANGVGLVALASNGGAYYTVGVDPAGGPPPGAAQPSPTTLSLALSTSEGSYGATLDVNATLALQDASGGGIAGKTLVFTLGSVRRSAWTNGNGDASVSLPITVEPGVYKLTVSFAGDAEYRAAADEALVTVTKQATTLTLAPDPAIVQYSDVPTVVATLADANNRRLREKTVMLIVADATGPVYAFPAITNFVGEARFDQMRLPAGDYTLTASFGGTIALPDGATINLTDRFYAATSASAALVVSAEDATVSYSGETEVPVGATLHLAAQVAQADDGAPGDLTGAQVRFALWQNGQPATLADGTPTPVLATPVSAEGVATATLDGLATGVYELRTTLIGGYFSAPSLSSLIAVYDAAGGFVTGGGWIWSPAGAYVADPEWEGKADFDFASKYEEGANRPDGNATFTFQEGTLDFRSTGQEWLVVAGDRATFQGEGRINGAGTYGFLITVVDGGQKKQDTFRIKIWDKSNGDAVIYDNQMGTSDDAYDGTELGNGSIVIHEQDRERADGETDIRPLYLPLVTR